MKQYTYHAEIMTMIEQFTSAFNDIIVKGYDKDKNAIDNSIKKVRFIYAPKQRVYESLITPGPGGISVPVVSISLGGITRDKTRVFNKNQGFQVPYHTIDNPDQLIKNIPQPVPINLTINMSIMTKYQEHMDQIISNFVPYCDPYIIISWKCPGLKESSVPYEIRSEVLWEGSIKTSYPQELQPNQPFRLTADTSFTIKGWLFKHSEETVKKIYYINSDFSPVDEKFLLEKLQTETISISAKPRIKSAHPENFTFWTGIGQLSSVNHFNVDLYGKYFFDIRNIYLSASNYNMLSGIQLWDVFSNYSKLSAKNPPFYGLKVPEFTISSDNHISFNIPQIPDSSGVLDIIAENEAGYGKLTVGCLRPSISSWSGWTLEQSVLSHGIPVNVYEVTEIWPIAGEIASDDGFVVVDEYGNEVIWV
jgi:hypothetical protein